MLFAISSPGNSLDAALLDKINNKTKPLGALGRLEELALQIGRVRGSLTPTLANPQLVVFAGDHGAAKAGISAFPQDVTWQMVENFLAGGAAINVFAKHNGLGLRVIDAGVAHDFGARDGLVDAKVGPGTRNYIEEPAMSAHECAAALVKGAEIARKLADEGCNVLGFGEMGIGNTAAASLLTHCLTGAELNGVIGRGTGHDDTGMERKRALLARAIARGGRPADPLTALAEYGGFEIAMMAGAMLGAAEAKMVLLIDGFIVTSALLVAHAIAPEILDYCVFAHRSHEAGHVVQLAHLGAEPLVQLDLRLGEGTGAALVYPLVQAAVNFLNEMASFESAGVAGKA